MEEVRASLRFFPGLILAPLRDPTEFFSFFAGSGPVSVLFSSSTFFGGFVLLIAIGIVSRGAAPGRSDRARAVAGVLLVALVRFLDDGFGPA